MAFNMQTANGAPLNNHQIPGQSGSVVSQEDYWGQSYFVKSPSVLAVGTSSVASGTIGVAGQVSVVRLCSNANCHYLVGANPTAASTSTYLPAGIIELVRVIGGQQIAVIQDAASTGSLSLSIINTTDL